MCSNPAKKVEMSEGVQESKGLQFQCILAFSYCSLIECGEFPFSWYYTKGKFTTIKLDSTTATQIVYVPGFGWFTC